MKDDVWDRITKRTWIWLVCLIVGTSVVAGDQAISPPPYGVRVEHVWIPMKDGTRLAADLYFPQGAKSGEKFPALLQYHPYRKLDGGIRPECEMHRYFAGYGYVGACVEIRGSGESEGQTPDREYSEQELNDGVEIIAWLARQPWSTGKVGMFGKSWLGFNTIQIAMRRPPELKAILATDATEQLYNGDVRYIDGVMDNCGWAVDIDHLTAITRAPDFPTDPRTLHFRFDNPPWELVYLHQQRDGPFWTQPERPLDAIEVPVFLIGGFFDGYRDTVPRMLEQLKVPVKAIVGPWNHDWPHHAVPGPEIEWRELALRWWDQWLKGRDTGIMAEPRLSVYMRHWYPPDPSLLEIPGEWRSEAGWPPQSLKPEILYLRSDHSLAREVPVAGVHELKYIPSAGFSATGAPHNWWGDLTPDQRPADAFSLVYDSAPLTEDTPILGRPEAWLEASATAPLADWFARLSDVAPDGQVTLVTGAALNGAQRESMSHPEDLEPDRVYSLKIPLHFTSWVFPRGHQIRLAVSNSLWPMMWPTPYAMTTSLQLGGDRASHLVLPVVPAEGPLRPPHFSAPRGTPELRYVAAPWTLQTFEFGKPTRFESGGGGTEKFPWGQKSQTGRLIYEVQDDHPEAASYRGENETSVQLHDRKVVWRSHFYLHSDQTDFYFQFKRELLENGKLIREKTWKETVPRDHQ
jgi:predicted acyl esterase